jgi:hypothetical protein
MRRCAAVEPVIKHSKAEHRGALEAAIIELFFDLGWMNSNCHPIGDKGSGIPSVSTLPSQPTAENADLRRLGTWWRPDL